MPSKRPARGGVEVRVFGDGRRGSYRGSGEGVVPEDEEAAEQLDESVVRLDKVAVPLANRRVEDEEQVEPVPLARSKRKLGLRGWTLIMAGSAILLAVASVWGAMAFNRMRPGQEISVNQLQVVDDLIPDESDEQALLADADGLIKRSIDLFKEYDEAETVDEVLGLIRNREQLRPVLEQRWKPLGVVQDQLSGRAIEYGHRYYIILSGMKDTGEPFEFVFVSDGEEVKIDWEASVAYGDVELDELRGMEVGQTVKMRVQMWPSNFFPLEYPEEEYRCFRINSGDGEAASIYGYAPLGSKVSNDMSEAWNEGTVLFRQETALAAIVYLRNGGRGHLGQFVISEFVQKGWIED